MDLLTGSLRNYSWGSRELIAQLRGQQVPSEHPEAELWFGAHPAGSALVGNTPLIDIIRADPANQLGSRIQDRFGNRLPFLLKLLAAAEPLSLQVHPSIVQAREGFERENKMQISQHAENRNYKDDNHKPELIVALTQFEAMAGFRPLTKTVELLAALQQPEVDRYLSKIDRGVTSEETALRALFTMWVNISTSERTMLIDAIIASAQSVITKPDTPIWMVEALTNVVELNEQYPHDVGVLGALLLNKFTLQPGEGLYLDAGQLHAYVRGLGVEIMANSDNVLRGGLTSKHVDVAELLRTLEFTSLENPLAQTYQHDFWQTYVTPIEEFRLSKACISSECSINPDGPAIVMVVDGAAELSSADTTLLLRSGMAAWIPACDGPVQICSRSQGATEVFLAEA